MRLRRPCEKKAKSKKCHVDDATHEMYVKGGQDREWLEIALLECLQKIGNDSKQRGYHKQMVVTSLQVMHVCSVDVSNLHGLGFIQGLGIRSRVYICKGLFLYRVYVYRVTFVRLAEATFKMQVKVIRERMEMKEKEISGEWLTIERMQKSGEYSKRTA